MIGSIIGDIVGSYYEVLEVNAIKSRKDKKRTYEERIKILDTSTPLFTSDSSYTDDTVLTIAIMDALMNSKKYEKYLKEYGLKEELGLDKYGRSRFGKGFTSWLHGEKPGNSYGNGASMRVGPIGFYYDTSLDVVVESVMASIPSHNSEEACIGASAVASSILFARTTHSKEKIRELVEKKFHFDVNFDLESLQRNYRFSSRTNNSVPQAIYTFLVSDSFEDAIRKSVSIGGDSDTIACICGGISEAYYGLPEELKTQALGYLSDEYKEKINEFYKVLELRKKN